MLQHRQGNLMVAGLFGGLMSLGTLCIASVISGILTATETVFR